MGGFLGIGGSSAKTDRGRELGGWNGEWNVFNTGMPWANQAKTSGDATTQTGMDSLNQANDFWKSIMSGNRTSNAAAAAPAVNAVTDQVDAAKREQATMGTARGGGVAEANQQAQTAQRAVVDNAFFAAQPKAATEVEKIGETQASLGSRQLAAALQALGISAQEAQHIVDSSITSRPTSIQANPANALPSVLVDAALGAFGL